MCQQARKRCPETSVGCFFVLPLTRLRSGLQHGGRGIRDTGRQRAFAEARGTCKTEWGFERTGRALHRHVAGGPRCGAQEGQSLRRRGRRSEGFFGDTLQVLASTRQKMQTKAAMQALPRWQLFRSIVT